MRCGTSAKELSLSDGFKALACLGLFVAFLFQMGFIARQFADEETAVSMQNDDFGKTGMELPAISVCAESPYKRPMEGLIDEEQYQSVTYAFGEMFPNAEANAMWNVSVSRSFLNGRCYTFRSDTKVKAVSLGQFIELKSGVNVNVYVHEPHDEFWLWNLLSPTKMAAQNVPATFQGDVHLEKRATEAYDRGPNCHAYNETFTFLGCAKDKIRANILKAINCTIPDFGGGLFDSIKDLGGLPECKTAEERLAMGDKAGELFAEFIQNLREYGCILPCKITYYKTRFNNFPGPNPKVKIYFYYDNLWVQTQYERLVYDLPGFLSALGGSLGLYLGLSCLTFANAFIELCSQKGRSCFMSYRSSSKKAQNRIRR